MTVNLLLAYSRAVHKPFRQPLVAHELFLELFFPFTFLVVPQLASGKEKITDSVTTGRQDGSFSWR